jgi:hypothetical protein
MTASARPRRLLNLAETTGAIADALTTRAGWMGDEWDAYSLHNGVDWRFDVSDLAGALRAWAQTLRAIGEFTGTIGTAFLAADDDDAGGVHRLSEDRLHDLLPDEAQAILDESTARDEVDWGDPDDPPAWLEALDFSAMAVGHVGSGVDAFEGALDWLLPDPDPGEHDPDIVGDQIDGVAPGTVLRDIPEYTWDVIEPVEQAGDEAGRAAFEDRHPYLDFDAVLADPGLVDDYELPAPWVRVRALQSLVGR